MFAALLGKSNPRVSSLKAMRKVYLAQLGGGLGHDLGDVLAAERKVWGRVLHAFGIDAGRGLDGNSDAIDALIECCREQSGRFDYLGLVIPALVQNSGFLQDEREMLARHLTTLGLDDSSRLPASGRGAGSHRSRAAAIA